MQPDAATQRTVAVPLAVSLPAPLLDEARVCGPYLAIRR